MRPARRWTEGRAVALAGLDATSCKSRFGFVVIDAARLTRLLASAHESNMLLREPQHLRFSQLRLKLDQRTLHGPHRCAVQSKVARAVARPQLQHALLQALALLSAAGPAGKSDALRHRDTAADTACCCW